MAEIKKIVEDICTEIKNQIQAAHP